MVAGAAAHGGLLTSWQSRLNGSWHLLRCCHISRRYPCVYCGPSPEYDGFIIEDDQEDEAYCIMDNFKAAYANK